MKKSFFGIVFNPKSQPGFEGRYSGNVKDTQLGKITPSKHVVDTSGFPSDPYREFNSRQVKEVNPTAWLRSKGYKV